MPDREIKKKLDDKRILVTGGQGFLGRHLCARLKELCKEVYLYDNDVRRINGFFKRYDIVCHLAGVTKAESDMEARLLFDVNVNGVLSVMRYCQEKSSRCIFASSSAVYRTTASDKPLIETSLREPATLYGLSKAMGEDICRYHALNYGVSTTAFRIFNMYGPGQKEPFLIPYVINRLSKNKPIILKAPAAVRDFIYVTDVVTAFIFSCAHEHSGFKVLNLGTGKGISVREMAERVALRMGIKSRVEKHNSRNIKKDLAIADIKNMLKYAHFRPKISIDEGLMLLFR
ncbi:MAG: NAD(P)-dependent oxidoreductase [Candidatus Omnitrophota bacterium]